MASWAKNQITKQLAKFAKNLDPNSLSLKFFKGEGELTNLELDETVLSDLLEFPPWLHLSKVTCNRISISVPWTSLKSDPIRLILDNVDVQIVASETAREKATNIPLFTQKTNTKPTKYGFAEKVLDGIYLSINTLTCTFTSLGFKASVNISRIIVQSTGPDWRPTKNLRHTRVKDDLLGEVMIFKEIKWSTMRVDADASYKPESNDIPSTPLRLITNNSSIRLTIKKKICDCTMIASKLQIILDDILWVLTRSQILKLSSFVHYILNLRSSYLPIQQQTALSNQGDSDGRSPAAQQGQSQNQLFQVYNIDETSIHLRTHRIDLHLCDDTTFVGNAPKPAPSNNKLSFDESGAALQISIVNVSLDQYPYHIVGKKRSSPTNSDEEVAFQRKRWATQLYNNFQETEGKQWKQPRKNTSAVGARQAPAARGVPVMYESYIIMSCQNFQIMQVTTMNIHDPKPVLSSEKEALYLPPEMSAFTIDHTTYYYAGGVELPVPAPNLFVQVNPIQLRYDPLTCIWLNRFAQSVITGLDWTKEFMSREPGFSEHLNVRVEALMPKVVIPLDNDKSLPHHDERPSSLQIQISQAVISNCRVGAKCSQTDILNDLQDFIGARLYADMSVFPNTDNDLHPYSNATWLSDYSINHHQLQLMTKRDPSLYSRLKRDANLPHQIWCFWCDQIWVEFAGVEKACDRPISFVDAFPLRIWICSDVSYYEPPPPRPSISTLSSDSVEVAEIATEFDELPTDIKFNKMNVVYDANVGRVDQNSLSPYNRLTPSNSTTASASSSPGPTRRSANSRNVERGQHRGYTLSPNRSENQCNGVLERYPKEDIDAMNKLRTSLSENDININPTNYTSRPSEPNCVQNNVDVRVVSDYARGGPPPPYSDEVENKSGDSLTASYSSLPPAYDALSDDPGPIEKPIINDFIEYDMDSSDLQRTASVAILMHTSKNVQLQLDHFQLLFLMRLAENIGFMMEKVEADNEKSNRERTHSLSHLNPSSMDNSEDMGVILNMMIPNIIVDLVLAPCIGIDPVQTYSLVERVRYEKEKVENKSEKLPLITDEMDCLPIISSCEPSESTNTSALVDMMSQQSHGVGDNTSEQPTASNESELATGIVDSNPGPNVEDMYPTAGETQNMYQPPPDQHLYTQSDDHGITGPLIVNESQSNDEHGSPSDPLHHLNQNQPMSEMNYHPREFYDQPAFDNSSNISGYSNEIITETQSKDVYRHSSLDDMYREVNENVTLGNMVAVPGNLHDPNAFDPTLKEVADIGIQVGTSMMDVNLKPRPEDQLISVLRIRVGSLFIGLETEGKDTLVKVSAETLRLNELGNMKYGKILDPRGIIGTERQQEKRQINMDSLTGSGILKLRLGTGSFAEQLAEGTSDTGFADIRVNSLAAALLMSTIDNLQEFGEDEAIGLGLPFAVDVTLSDISIYDDKPRRYKSAIKLPPAHIVIDEIYLTRSKDGVTTIKEKQGRKPTNETLQVDSTPMIGHTYNATLNGTLIAETINQQVEALIGENSRLLEDLKVVNAKMNGLHSERDSLLKVIDKLQQELVYSNRETEDLHNRVRTLSLSRHQGHYV